MEQTTQQAVNPQPVNYMEALFDAVNLAVSSGQNYQLAVGLGTEQAVKMEDQVYNSWKFSLTKSQQFSPKMTKYETWMSVGQLKSMENKELASLHEQAASLAKDKNACKEFSAFAAAGYGTAGIYISNHSFAYWNSEEKLNEAKAADLSKLGKVGGVSTSAGAELMFSKMVEIGATSQINGSYLKHHSSKVTLSQLANHLAGAPTSQLTVLNTLYGEAQRQQQQQVQQADSGVQADQNQLTQISSNNQQKTMLVSSANSLMSLCANGAIQ